jgi:xanthine dehydrogenase accessory factor
MEIINEIAAVLRGQERVVLATIVAASGSTPLPPGAMMVIRKQQGAVLGTIGGGAIEAKVINAARQLFVGESVPVLQWFELDEEDTEGGMICGGRVEILTELIECSEEPLFSRIHRAHIDGSDCALVRFVDLKTATIQRMMLSGASMETVISPFDAFLGKLQVTSDRFIENVLQAHHHETIKRIAGRDGEVILQPIVGVQPLVIFGGGHIARTLSRIATIAGFTVTVVDDREEYANPRRFPEAAQTLAAGVDEAFQQIQFKSSTSIVIVTRGHSTDAAILERAVRTSSRYIGMIGSTKKVITTYSQLQKQGVPLPLLKRVAAPIGLDIGAVSAEEIAVSILAEVIQMRRGSPGASVTMTGRLKEWFDEA